MSSGSSTSRDVESTARREHDHWPELFDAAVRGPQPARRGVGTRGERLLDVGAAIVVMTLVVGWVWSFANARSLYAASPNRPLPIVANVAASLTHADAPSAAYLTDATLLA